MLPVVLSLTDDELLQVRLREASQLVQRVILRHRQAGDVWRQLGYWDAAGSHLALLQAQHRPQDVRHTLRHFCKEAEFSKNARIHGRTVLSEHGSGRPARLLGELLVCATAVPDIWSMAKLTGSDHQPKCCRHILRSISVFT